MSGMFLILLLRAVQQGWAVLVKCKPILGGPAVHAGLGGPNILEAYIVEC
jgi:hypothetical protein